MYPLAIIENLRKISGTNDKLSFLKANTNPLFERCFHFAYSSEHVFGIRKIPTYVKNPIGQMTLEDALDVLENSFETRELTGNAAIDSLLDMLERLHQDDAEVLAMIIKGSFDCGVNISNANKCFVNPIPTFDTMLCAKQSQKLIDKLFSGTNEVFAQIKSDGMRVIVSVDNNRNVRYRSRNGKDLQMNAKYNDFFSRFPGLCFDGEMLIASEEGDGFADRKTGNGLLNSIRQGKASEVDCDRVRFILWDVINFQDYMSGFSSKTYGDRFEDLYTLHLEASKPDVWLLVESRMVSDFDQAQEYYSVARARGEEGLILKDAHASWSGKRVNHQIKMKAEETLDLRVIEVKEGSGKYEGMLGAVICEDESGDLRVSVGSGFDEEQREEFWGNSLVGTIIEVKYNEVISSKGREKLNLFLPIFDRVRDDKKVADNINLI